MKNPVTSQTIVASSVFLDLVGFSKLPTSVQVLAKNRFNATLRLGLAELGESNYWVRDLGDGALIVCQNSPEHALFLALNVHQAFVAFEVAVGMPPLQLRIGLHLGVLKSNPDLEGRPNFLGDGINATQRVMDFAQPGQILASRSFVDALAFLHADYATMFSSPQSRPDKHGRMHEVYAVEPSVDALARLREEATAGRSHQPQVHTAPTVPATESAPPVAPHEPLIEHTFTLVRNWLSPLNTLLVTGGVLWAGFQRFGLSGKHAELFGLALAVVGALVWWAFRRRSAVGAAHMTSRRTGSAIGLQMVAVGCLVSATAWIATFSSELAATAPVQAQTAQPEKTVQAVKVVPPPKEPDRTDVPRPAATVAAVIPPVPAAAPVVKAKVVTPEKKSLAVALVTVSPPSPASESDRRRCTALLNRSALGETISIAEKQELMQSCR